MRLGKSVWITMKGSWVLTGCSGVGGGAIWQGVAVIGGRDGVERPVGRERQAESVAAIVLIIKMLLIPPAPLLRQEVQGKY